MPSVGPAGRERDGDRLASLKSPSGRVIAQMPDSAIYFEQCYWPFLDEADEDLDAIESLFAECMWSGVPSPPGPLIAGEGGAKSGSSKARERFARKTDRAIIGLFGGNLLELGQWFYRMDRFLMMMAAEPERVPRPSWTVWSKFI